MAITLGQILDFPSAAIARMEPRGSTFVGVVELVGDTSYPTGGYAIPASLLGLTQIQFVVPMCTSAGYVAVWDQVNGKIKLFHTGAVSVPFVEETAATNVSAVKMYLLVSGT